MMNRLICSVEIRNAITTEQIQKLASNIKQLIETNQSELGAVRIRIHQMPITTVEIEIPNPE